MPKDKDRHHNSPAHWQGEPVPHGHEDQTQDVGFDRRGAGRARQYGRAGAYGQRYNEKEQRPARGPTPADEVLRNAVHDVLRRNDIDARTVHMTVDEGLISLRGTVASQDEKYKIEQLVANCQGVISVRNDLTVSPSSRDDAVM